MEVPSERFNIAEQFLPVKILKRTKDVQNGGNNLISSITNTWNKIFLVSSDKSPSTVREISKEVIQGLAYASPAKKGQPHILPHLYQSLQKRPDFFYVNPLGAERLLRNTQLSYIMRPSSQTNSFALSALDSKGELNILEFHKMIVENFFVLKMTHPSCLNQLMSTSLNSCIIISFNQQI